MDADLKWIIGIGAGLLLSFATMLIGAFRNLANRISANSATLHTKIDKVKDDYVRRDDLDGHIQRIDENVRDLRHEMRENHTQVMEAIRGGKSP